MACELSSSFSQENRIQASEELWWWTGTGRAEDSNFYFGRGTQVVPMDDEVYTIVGHPGTQTGTGTDPANQGSVYIFRSSSSGIDTEIIIGPGGNDAPSATTGSNYVGLDLSGEDWHNANFGVSNAAISSSTGLWLASAAPGLAEYAGQILLFHSTSAGGVQQISDPDQKLTGSVSDSYYGTGQEGDSGLYSFAGSMKVAAGVGGQFSDSSAITLGTLGNQANGKPLDGVSLAFDENEQNLYISFYDSVLSDSGTSYTGGTMNGTYNTGGIRLYKSSSAGGIEHLQDITVSSGQLDEQVGSAHEMIVADGKVYIAASATKIYSTVGRSFLFTYDISADTYTEESFAPSSETNTNVTFGTGKPDIVSGSDGIYILQGAGYRYDTTKAYGGEGRSYLFKSSSSGIDLQLTFSGSTGAQSSNGYDLLGWSNQLVSGANGVTVLTNQLLGTPESVSYLDEATPTDKRHVIWIYETDGSSTNATYRIDESNSSTLNSLSEFGWATQMDARLSSDGERLYIASSNPDYSTNTGATILYEWGLSGSCSEQQQQQQGGQNMSTDKRGLAVYSGSSGAVHKFLDDGSSQIGTDSSKQHNMSGNLYVSASAIYDIEAVGDVSASAYHGDGSNLTNINATPDISESSADFYFVGAAAIANDQSLVGESDRGPKFVEASKRMEVHALSASGDADLNGALDVAGTSTMKAVNAQATTVTTLSASGQADFAGAINADGAVDFDSTLDVQGAANFQSTITASGDADLNGALDVAGIADFQSRVDAQAGLDVTGSVRISSTLDAQATTVTTMSASSNIQGGGTLTIAGAASFDGGATASTMAVSDLTSGRIVLAGTSGELEDSGNLTFDGSKVTVTGEISASAQISASAFYGDGSALTNVSSENVDTTAASSNVDYHIPFTVNYGDQDNQILYSDSNGDLKYNPSQNLLTVPAVQVNNNLTVDANAVIRGDENTEVTLDIRPTAGATSDVLNVRSRDASIAFKVDELGDSTFEDSLTVNGGLTGSSVQISDLTSGRVVLAGTSGEIEDSADFTFDGSTLTIGATQATALSASSNIQGGGTLTIAGDADLNGALDVAGATTLNGDVTLGNANTDKVIFTADISSSLLPDDNGTAFHDLGSTTKKWNNLYIDGIGYIDQLGANTESGRVDAAYISTLSAQTTTVTTMSASSNIQGGGTLTIAGAADLNGALDVAGTSTMQAVDAQATTVTTMSASSNIQGGGTLTIAGDADFNGAFDAEGAANFQSTITAAGDADLNGALAVAGAATMESTLAVNGNSTLGDANADLTTINGRLMMSSFSGQVAADRATMVTLAASGDASAFNGSMIYVSSPYTGSNASAAFFFDNGEKWYFCENGTWYPSSFNS